MTGKNPRCENGKLSQRGFVLLPDFKKLCFQLIFNSVQFKFRRLAFGVPVVGSTYWNMVYGRKGCEAVLDLEGMQTMRNLARNMAWMLKCFEAGREKGIELPRVQREDRTNFIR